MRNPAGCHFKACKYHRLRKVYVYHLTTIDLHGLGELKVLCFSSIHSFSVVIIFDGPLQESTPSSTQICILDLISQ